MMTIGLVLNLGILVFFAALGIVFAWGVDQARNDEIDFDNSEDDLPQNHLV